MLIYKEMNQKNEGKVNLIIAEGDIGNVFSMKSSNTKGTEDGEENSDSKDYSGVDNHIKFATLLLRFLQLLCEGHNNTM